MSSWTESVSTSWDVVTFPGSYQAFTVQNQGPGNLYIYCNPPAGFSARSYHVLIYADDSSAHIFYGTNFTGVALQSDSNCSVLLSQVGLPPTGYPTGYKYSTMHNMSYAVVEDIGTSGPALEAMIPSGGSQGQVLSVLSASPRVLGWVTASGSGGGGSATWGTITGTLWNQADLSQVLASKAPLASPTFTGTVTTPSLKFTTSPQAGYVLTSDASGNMSLQPSAAGHTIEASGSAMTQRPALNFTGSGVSVTDDSVNNATVVTISGGSDLVQTYPGGGNAYIPGLRGSPDSIPSSPSAYNDEFDTFSGWTTIGTLDVLNVTDRISHLHMVKKATGTMTISGVYKPSPTPPFTVTAKRSDFSYWTNYQQCALMIGANPPGGMLVFGTTADTSTPNKSEWDVWTSPTSRSSYNVNQWILYPQFCPYWRIVVHSSTSVDLSFSYGGTVFLTVASGINPGFTVGSVGFTLTGNDYSVYTEVLWDWIRFT